MDALSYTIKTNINIVLHLTVSLEVNLIKSKFGIPLLCYMRYTTVYLEIIFFY